MLEQVTDVQQRLRAIDADQQHLQSTEELLVTLAQRLDQPPDFVTTRQLVEWLVQGIRVSTIEGPDGRKEAEVEVTYVFEPAPAIGTCTEHSAARRRRVRELPARVMLIERSGRTRA